MAKLKPRFHSLFIIYLVFGSLLLGIMYYAMNFGYGKDATKDILKLEEISIKDEVVDISNLTTAEQVYPHAGGIKKLTTRQGIVIPLYVENPESVDKIEPTDSIMKSSNSRDILIFSGTNSATIHLSDIQSLRQRNQRKSALTWLLAYIIIGFCVTLVPFGQK